MCELGQELRRIAGDANVLSDMEDRLCYSYDSTHVEHLPEFIVRPRTTSEVIEIMRLANDTMKPVVPRGAGTGLSGGSVAISGGIVMDLTRMNSVLEVNSQDLYAVVEPGVITLDLQNQVAVDKLLYPPDPGSNSASTIGGNIAENAGGLRGLKYGVTQHYVMGLEVVAPTGEVFRTGSKTVKCVTGFDLTRLMVGSEGTLGVVTRATLRLIPAPEFGRAMLGVFDETMNAARAVSKIIEAGVVPATLEYLDRVTVNAVEDFKPCGLPRDAEAVLLCECDGYREAAEREAAAASKIMKDCGARRVDFARDDAEKAAVWAGRRAALAALTRVMPTTILEDATVPRSRIPDIIEIIRRIAAEYDLGIGTFGHAGDGNLHPTFLTDERNAAEIHRVEMAVDDLFKAALELGGTLSGEHGIGVTKAKFLAWELGPEGVGVMRRIKKAMDPRNILNPGKMDLGDFGGVAG
ncbi:MAG: FAD-binding protein [Firmicutes bacterium]|nr:FAD-binding protein [Bacillota bacterium]